MRWLTLFLAFVAAPVAAQEIDCSGGTALAQVEMTFCAGQELEAADGDLNLAYKLARDQAGRIDESGIGFEVSTVILLRDAQRAWITFRDNACSAEARLAFGGTMQNQIYLECLSRLTRARTEDLRYFGEVN